MRRCFLFSCKVLWAALIIAVIAFSSAAQSGSPFVPRNNHPVVNAHGSFSTPPAQLTIDVKPGASRPFILANRSGTYFYGCSGDKGWDDGWMGLWVNRKRVLSKFTVMDSAGRELLLDRARCRVTPNDVTWSWDKPRACDITIFFPKLHCDSLYYISPSGLRIEGGVWFQPSARDSEFTRSMTTWLLSSDSRAALPADYLETKIRSEQSDAYFSCGDENYSQAVAWAHLQLLFLLAENDSLLYAGIPWFNEGWGRDTFISLRGFLVTGHADIAKKLLLRFAGWLDRDPKSPTYGRIPNRVRPDEEIAYNTADGTPWWILGLYDYGLYSHDFDFWTQMTHPPDSTHNAGPVLIALAGALSHCDSLGFLQHGPAETWMDAVGPNGAVTPRDDRAIEITALHHASLDAAIRMVSYSRDARLRDSLKVWRAARQKIEEHFLGAFLNPRHDGFCDRLRSDGTVDTSLRPNQLFALTVPLSPLVPPELRTRVVATVAKDLAHPYGVLSLSPSAPNFHPFHMDEHYPKDDAYHTGIVWTWLSGPAKTALRMEGRTDLALELANYEAKLLLTRGCVGSLPEVTDAMPRKGRKEVSLSGIVSQAWSLAEFLRTTYQDVLGIRPVQVSGHVEPFWLMDPRLPQSWGRTEARVMLDSIPLWVTMQNFGDSVSVTVYAEQIPKQPIGVKFFDETQGVTGFLRGQEPVHVVYVPARETVYVGGTPTAKVKLHGWPYDKGPQQIKLAAPITRTDFASLKPPSWDVLTAKDVLRKGEKSYDIMWAKDPACDDTGSCGYTYPLDEQFKSGILDITNFTVRADKQSYFFTLTFRDLVQPGWHPEYGFQLTFAAICLHDASGKHCRIGANANYPWETTASRVIYIGGGIRVDDDSNRVLAQFTPQKPTDAFGDTTTKQIAFSLPQKYFPKYDRKKWDWIVLVGAQDDHGGAGIGEFRSVKAIAEQWAGGHNICNGPNVYDEMRAFHPLIIVN
jgi:glycogen debranching enzyme